MMRLLLLDVAARYINPTRNLLVRMLSGVGETVPFGPGYVSSDVLRRGLKAFIALHGPFDVAVATEHIVFAQAYAAADVHQSFRQNYCLSFPLEELNARSGILDDLREARGMKLALLLESDYYNFSQSQIEELERTFDLVAGFGRQFLRRVGDLPGLTRELFAPSANDHWLDFVTSRDERVIPLVHFVCDAEFDFTALAHRPGEWCVPGTPYDARRRASAVLAGAGARIANARFRRAPSMLTRLGLRPFARPWVMAQYQESFREEIRRARYAFTCGSALRWPIRKFFEIPALGAVLVCVPCSGFEALGFQDGQNACCCEPEGLPELGRRLNADPDHAQAVADAGRRLVGRFHTLAARAAQLKAAMELALAGRWRGATWRDGVMIPAAGAVPTSPAAPLISAR